MENNIKMVEIFRNLISKQGLSESLIIDLCIKDYLLKNGVLGFGEGMFLKETEDYSIKFKKL